MIHVVKSYRLSFERKHHIQERRGHDADHRHFAYCTGCIRYSCSPLGLQQYRSYGFPRMGKAGTLERISLMITWYVPPFQRVLQLAFATLRAIRVA